MPSLARRVGLGLNAQGDVRAAVQQAARAERLGLDSVWFHESYFARDAVTYATAVATEVPRIGIGLGALNPNTRHPVLLAMTVSALDDLAPGRISLALGTALPLRLAQMGIPYQPDPAIAKVEQTMTELRRLWRGERLPTPADLPELEPMFPPVHQVPLWAAGYRRAFHELAGRTADGYLARPAEPIQAVELAVGRIRQAALAAGRDPAAVAIGGYLLCLIDSSRRAALDRAKREPFAIYMLSVQTDVAMRRAQQDPALRQRIFAAWRAEDYHGAAQLIPDRLVDAFFLCGTREEVAAGAERFQQAGMTLPILQPVVQEEAQVEAVLEAAAIYGAAGQGAPAWGSGRSRPSASSDRIGVGRHLRGWVEIFRPFALTASVVPVAAAGALAAAQHRFSWPLFALVLAGAVLLQIGTNVVNEIYDVRKGVDAITSPRASQAILTGRVGEREAFAISGTAFLLATLIGVVLILARGWPVAVIGVVGLVGGWGYTAPPLQYKYRAAGLPLVFLLMGPLMVLGAYFAITGRVSVAAAAASLPIGLLVTAILHGNEWRDIGEDARAGISTVSIRAGRRAAHHIYVVLLVGAFVALALTVALGVLPRLSLLAVLSLPLLVRALNASELGAAGQQRAIAMIDLETAQLHACFGLLLVVGLAVSAAWHPA